MRWGVETDRGEPLNLKKLNLSSLSHQKAFWNRTVSVKKDF